MLSEDDYGFTKSTLLGVLIIGVIIGGGIGFGLSMLTTPSNVGNNYSTTIQVAGSDTLLELARAWADNYTDRNLRITIYVAGGGTGTGMASLLNGGIDIADASRLAKTSEIATATSLGITLIKHTMVIDGISIVVHNSNLLNNITYDALRRIYNGTITHWDEINSTLGHNPIVAYSRQSTSGTYAYFQEEVMDNDEYSSSIIQLAGNADIINNVKDDTNGIGYVGAAYAEAAATQIKTLAVAKITGDTPVEPLRENIANFSYPISRYLYCYTNGHPVGFIQAYISWCQSSQGQEIAEDLGYIAAYPIIT